MSAFHAVTCCDKVSFFGGKGKLKAWNTWTAFPTVTSAFFELGTEKANLSQDACDKIEQFVVFMYEKNSDNSECSKAKLFSQRCKYHRSTGCSSSAHSMCSLSSSLRAAYQAFVWGQCLHRAPRLGMTKDEGQTRKSVWTTLRQAEDSCYEPIHCGCKQDCKTRCKCAAVSFPCTGMNKVYFYCYCYCLMLRWKRLQ